MKYFRIVIFTFSVILFNISIESHAANSYGMIPFHKEISQQVKEDMGSDYDDFEHTIKDVIIKKSNNINNIEYFEQESGVDYSKEDKKELKNRLEQMSSNKNINVLIFGSLKEYEQQEIFTLSIETFSKSKGEFSVFPIQYLTKKELISIKAWLLEIIASVLLETKIEDNVASQNVTPPQAQGPKTNVVISPRDDITFFLPHEELKKSPSPKPKQSNPLWNNRKNRTINSLKDIYVTLYEENFFVYPVSEAQHEQALAEAAKDKGINLSNFIDNLKSHRRKNEEILNQDSCDTQTIISRSESISSGSDFKLCFQPMYIIKPSKKCENITGKMTAINYEKVEQEINQLNINTNKWKIPTIEELFAMQNILPHPAEHESPIIFWSSTNTEQSKRWGISISTKKNQYNNDEISIPSPVLLSESDSAFLLPMFDCYK